MTDNDLPLIQRVLKTKEDLLDEGRHLSFEEKEHYARVIHETWIMSILSSRLAHQLNSPAVGEQLLPFFMKEAEKIVEILYDQVDKMVRDKNLPLRKRHK